MTISVKWDDNGDLIISCGGEEVVVPKNSVERRQSGVTPHVIITFPVIDPILPSTVVCDLLTATQGNYKAVASIDEMKRAISRSRRGKGQKEKLYLGWNSKDAIPIGEINAMLKSGAAVPFEIGVFSLNQEASSK